MILSDKTLLCPLGALNSAHVRKKSNQKATLGKNVRKRTGRFKATQLATLSLMTSRGTVQLDDRSVRRLCN